MSFLTNHFHCDLIEPVFLLLFVLLRFEREWEKERERKREGQKSREIAVCGREMQ